MAFDCSVFGRISTIAPTLCPLLITSSVLGPLGAAFFSASPTKAIGTGFVTSTFRFPLKSDGSLIFDWKPLLFHLGNCHFCLKQFSFHHLTGPFLPQSAESLSVVVVSNYPNYFPVPVSFFVNASCLYSMIDASSFKTGPNTKVRKPSPF